ncbi:hypothetical protein E2C01_023805 [Portunus trituberculatus]|uniref:Uncharacterized protein n=1 Tax=Portunus trituberculatus TaxID=210409 RepID=A0A5B7EB12_PORTR|nr:hypothetical protein [Portunus trituberculatus]
MCSGAENGRVASAKSTDGSASAATPPPSWSRGEPGQLGGSSLAIFTTPQLTSDTRERYSKERYLHYKSVILSCLKINFYRLARPTLSVSRKLPPRLGSNTTPAMCTRV